MSAQLKKELVAIEPTAIAPATILNVIASAAKDPSVDIDKLERLMAMHERMTARDSETAFNEAMTACQGEMRQIATDAVNPQTHSRYATFAQLDRYLRPIYTKHGFSLSFDEADSSKPEHVRVVCYVSHSRGHTRTYHRDMPADGKGAKGGDVMTKTHAAGAAGSYGARYLLKGIFNVAVGEHDNDGNAGATEEQIETAKGNLEAAAKKGMTALHKAWGDLPPALKVTLKDMKDPLKHKAADVDAAK